MQKEFAIFLPFWEDRCSCSVSTVLVPYSTFSYTITPYTPFNENYRPRSARAPQFVFLFVCVFVCVFYGGGRSSLRCMREDVVRYVSR